MTIEDIKSKKMKLEELILSLISQFEKETETKITDIQVNHIYIDGIYFSTISLNINNKFAIAKSITILPSQ